MEEAYIKKLRGFLDAWMVKNWQGMIDNSQLTWVNAHKDAILALQQFLSSVKPKKYEIKTCQDITVTAKDIDVALSFKMEGVKKKVFHRTITARVVCEEALNKPSVSGTWGVNPISVLRGIAGGK